jgi:hypothetical protein
MALGHWRTLKKRVEMTGGGKSGNPKPGCPLSPPLFYPNRNSKPSAEVLPMSTDNSVTYVPGRTFVACEFTNRLHNRGNYFQPRTVYGDERADLERADESKYPAVVKKTKEHCS